MTLPPPQESSSNSKLLNAYRLLTLYKKLRDSYYYRVLKTVGHHDPVQSARPRSSPKRAVENAAKGEFLQRSRPLDTVNLPLEDDAEQLTPDVPPNQATPPPALCRRTCRQTP